MTLHLWIWRFLFWSIFFCKSLWHQMSEVDGFDLLWTCTLTISNVLFDVFVICYHTSHLVLYTSLHPPDRVFLTHLAPSNFLVLQILSFYKYCHSMMASYGIWTWLSWFPGKKVLHYMGKIHWDSDDLQKIKVGGKRCCRIQVKPL